jgi:hypothetical protein
MPALICNCVNICTVIAKEKVPLKRRAKLAGKSQNISIRDFFASQLFDDLEQEIK